MWMQFSKSLTASESTFVLCSHPGAVKALSNFCDGVRRLSLQVIGVSLVRWWWCTQPVFGSIFYELEVGIARLLDPHPR